MLERILIALALANIAVLALDALFNVLKALSPPFPFY